MQNGSFHISEYDIGSYLIVSFYKRYLYFNHSWHQDMKTQPNVIASSNKGMCSREGTVMQKSSL